MSNLIFRLFEYLGAACIFICLITNVYLKLTMARRFDLLFKNVKPRDAVAMMSGYKNSRFIAYTDMIFCDSFYRNKKDSQLYTLYKGYDFRAHVNAFELVLVQIFSITAYVFAGCCLVIILIAPIMYWESRSGLLFSTLHLLGLTTLLVCIISVLLGIYFFSIRIRYYFRSHLFHLENPRIHLSKIGRLMYKCFLPSIVVAFSLDVVTGILDLFIYN